jgi:hypothetical protein
VIEGENNLRVENRAVLMAVFIIIIISLPTFVDAFAPGTKWIVRGYVKKSGTSTPISGATVRIWNDDVYLGQVYTSSTGYFSYSTTRRPTNNEIGWQITVSASGYVTTTRYATPVDYITDVGTIYMILVPPPPPPTPAVISNVAVAIGGVREVIISWDVDWDDSCTGYLSKCWWSADTAMGSEDLFFSTTTKQSSYSVTVPADMVRLTGGTFYYQIYARNSKNGYYPETYYGPQSVVLSNVWIVIPTDDAYTQQWDQYGGNHNYNTNLLYVEGTESTGLNARAWLRFDVPYSSCLEKATLYIWYDMYYPQGNPGYGHTIDAFSSDPNWLETTITHNNAPSVGRLLDSEQIHCPAPTTAAYQQWDVTTADDVDDVISITLCDRTFGGPYLYSKEASTHRPYLSIKYWGEPEAPMQKQFIDDEFALRTPDIYNWESDIWIHTTQNNPRANLALAPYSPYPSQNDPILGRLFYSEAPAEPRNDWCGHLLAQNGLDIKGPFFFVAQVRISNGNGVNALAQKIRLELFGGSPNPLAECSYIWHEYDWAPPQGGTQFEIFGSATDGFTTHSDSNYRNEMYGCYNLVIERTVDGYINVGFAYSFYPTDYLLPYEILASIYNPEPISCVRLSMLYKGEITGYYPDTEMMCFGVRECKSLAMANPHYSYNPFLRPVREFDFDLNYSTPIYWKDYDLTEPTDHGYLYVEQGIDKSWRAPANLVGSNHWYLRQPLVEVNEVFKFSAIEGQRISFTFLARHDTTDVMVRGMILYRAQGESASRAVGGEWTTVPNDDNWHEISATTDSPLPASLDYIEIIMEGISEPGQLFSVFVDIAQITCIQNDIASGIISGGCALSFGIGVIPMSGEGGAFSIGLMPSVILQTGVNCHVTDIEYIVEVNRGDLSINSNGIVEANNKEYHEPGGTRHEMDKWYVTTVTGIAKWVPRIVLFAADIGAPVSWVVGDFTGALADSYINSWNRHTAEYNTHASVNDPIDLIIDYPGQVEVITTSLELTWNLNYPGTYPVTFITFIVHWIDSSGEIQTTAHSLLLTFNYLG